MSAETNDLRLRLIDIEYGFSIRFMRSQAISFSVISPFLAGTSAITGYGAATIHKTELARQNDHKAAWQSWQANPPQTVAAAKVTFGKHDVLGEVVNTCADKLVSDTKPQPYTLQADNSLAVSAPVFTPQQVQQKFTTCVAEKVLPVALEQPGYGTTALMGGMSLAAAAGAVFVGLQAKKSWALYIQGKAEHEKKRAALLQPTQA